MEEQFLIGHPLHNNNNADALSRIHFTEVCTIGQATDPGPIKEERPAEMHDNPLGGQRDEQDYDKMKPFTAWPGMKQ